MNERSCQMQTSLSLCRTLAGDVKMSAVSSDRSQRSRRMLFRVLTASIILVLVSVLVVATVFFIGPATLGGLFTGCASTRKTPSQNTVEGGCE